MMTGLFTPCYPGMLDDVGNCYLKMFTEEIDGKMCCLGLLELSTVFEMFMTFDGRFYSVSFFKISSKSYCVLCTDYNIGLNFYVFSTI